MANYGLIAVAVKEYPIAFDSDYTRPDAWQDGYIGLVRAVHDFDPGRGTSLSTYALPKIRSAMQVGRGHSRGGNFRASLRNGEVPIRPASIDAEMPEGLRLSDIVPDPSEDTEAQAVDAAFIDAVRRLEPVICTDDLDRAVLGTLLDDPRPMHRVRTELAVEWGVSPQTVRSRQIRMARRLAVHMGER